MATRLNTLFNIEKDEESIVALLLLQSVFLGIFAGAFDVGAHSLFLKVFDASQIPVAFMISGLVGIFITSIYTRLQRAMKFSYFMVVNLLFVALSTLLLRLGFMFSDSKELVYSVFVLMGPLTIISFLGFWGNVSRIFTLRQGKRLFGIVDTGQIVGIILSSYAIPVLMSLQFAILDTLLISTTSIFIALIIQLFISRKAHFNEILAPVKARSNRTGFANLFKSRYTLLITFFIVFSVMTAFFIHYSFITVLNINYPEPENFATFLGFFMGTLMVFTIIIKTFLYGRLMKMYGLRFALLVGPVLLGIFTLTALITGGIYGIHPGTAGFTMFFLILALSKLFVKSLKDSMEVPSSKILYQSLQPEIRYDVQARIDGTINEISAFFSGLLLAGLGLMATINLLNYSAVLVIIVVLWGITGGMLYKAYRNSLYDALKRFRESETVYEESVIGIKEELQGYKLLFSLRLLPRLWNGYFTKKIHFLQNHPEQQITEEASAIIQRLGIFEYELLPTDTKISVADIIESEHESSEITAWEAEIDALLKECDPESRKKAIFLISRSGEKKLLTRLIPLFKDYDPVVRASAIRAAGYAGNKDIAHYLVDLLEDKVCYPMAFHALVQLGASALDALENAYYKTGNSDKTLIRITRAIAGIDAHEKYHILLGKLDHININVVQVALAGMNTTTYRPTQAELNRIIPCLRRAVDMAARNFALLVSVKAYLPGTEVRMALEEEFKDNIDMIFSFLSLAYDPQLVYHIRQSYESGTTQGIGFAIELLDLFIDDAINPFLFPLFEDCSDTEKIKNLQAEYPVEIQKVPDVLYAILNSSLDRISNYTRICALKELNNLKEHKPSYDVISQAFNLNPAVRDAAFNLIHNYDKSIIDDIYRRVASELNLSELKYSINTNQENVLVKIEYLGKSTAFASLKRKLLPEFANCFTITEYPPVQNRKLSEVFNPDEVILILEGGMHLRTTKGHVFLIHEEDMLMSSQIYQEFGGDCYIDSLQGILFMRANEIDLRELFFDYEKESVDLIEKMAAVHEKSAF